MYYIFSDFINKLKTKINRFKKCVVLHSSGFCYRSFSISIGSSQKDYSILDADISEKRILSIQFKSERYYYFFDVFTQFTHLSYQLHSTIICIYFQNAQKQNLKLNEIDAGLFLLALLFRSGVVLDARALVADFIFGVICY